MIRTTGRFVNERYRGMRMRPPEWVADDERASMFAQRVIYVHDARTLADAPALATYGFALAHHRTRVSDFYDEAQIPFLFDECREFCRRLTGCDATRVLTYQYRNSPPGTWDGTGSTLRAPMVRHEPLFHLDVTPYAEFPLDAAVNGRHFRIYTFWRNCNFRHPVQTMPLALCDVRSVLPEDIVFAESLLQRDPPQRGYSYRLVHRRTQQWYYFPAMSADEILVHKQYDSLEEASHRRGVFHGAVSDPTVGPDAPPRETVEVRVLALFEEESDKLARVRRFQAEIPPEVSAVLGRPRDSYLT